MKSLLFTIAHRVKPNFVNFSEALKYAWKVIKLRVKLTREVVTFKFRKVDGSIRVAIGTLKAEFLPASKGTGRSNPGVFTYFDIEKQGYRCAKIESLIF